MPPHPTAPAVLPLQERFVSVQGEGLLCGTPSSFIRVAGCNLRCAWCDTPRSSWDPQSTRATLADIEAFCRRGPRHVVLTGGEPALFPALAHLSQRLHVAGHHITLETAGTRWLEGFRGDLISLSPKLSHSTPRTLGAAWAARHEGRRWQPSIVRRWLDTYPWQLKFVIRTRNAADLEHDRREILGMLAALHIEHHERDRVLLMPETTDPGRLQDDYRALLPLCHAEGFRLGQRLHLQLFGHTPGT